MVTVEELAGLSATGEKEDEGGKPGSEELTKEEVDESFHKLAFEVLHHLLMSFVKRFFLITNIFFGNRMASKR